MCDCWVLNVAFKTDFYSLKKLFVLSSANLIDFFSVSKMSRYERHTQTQDKRQFQPASTLSVSVNHPSNIFC